MDEKIRNILVIRTDRIGDVLLSMPAVRALKEKFPGSGISMLVKPLCYDVVSLNPDIDEVIVLDKEPDSFKKKIDFIKFLKRGNFDLAVIMNPDKFFNIAVFFAGIKNRIGYARKCGFLLNHTIKDQKYQAKKHEVEYNLDLVRVINADTDNKNPGFYYGPEAEAKVKTILAEYNIASDSIVAVHPCTSNLEKQWDIRRFAELIRRIHFEFKKTICIVAAADEQKTVDNLKEYLDIPVVDLTGKLNLKELGAFLKCSEVLISNDSGPVHIAAAVGTRTVAVFARGVEGVNPKRWGPYGDGHVVIWEKLSDLSVDRVFGEVKAVV